MRLPTFSKCGRVISNVVICVGTLNALSGMIVNFVLKNLSEVSRDRGLLILWYTNGGLSILIDSTIWFLPIPIVFRLQKIGRRKKVMLFLTFSLGLMCPITALGRLCVVRQASKLRGDLAWSMAYIHILTTAEVGLAISAVSLATLRPLLNLVLNWCKGTGSLSWKVPIQPTGISEGSRKVVRGTENGPGRHGMTLGSGTELHRIDTGGSGPECHQTDINIDTMLFDHGVGETANS